MKKGFQHKALLLPGVIFAVLLINSKTAIQGAAEAAEQCIMVIVPSLFPFFFVSGWLRNNLQGMSLPILSFLLKLLRLPKCCDGMLLTAFLGGYPVGAKTIADACRSNTISKRTAHILLGYCNNAGPAFIFAVGQILFSSIEVSFILWLIQLLSAVITGLLLPRPSEDTQLYHTENTMPITVILTNSIRITANVCGWVILFRTLMHILSEIPLIFTIRPYIGGMLELSSGSLMLVDVPSPALRFLLFSIFLSAGGFCVYLQTLSAVGSVGKGLYATGKAIQTAVGSLISIPVSLFLFHELPASAFVLIAVSGICVIFIILLRTKSRKTCGNYGYNRV